VSVKGSKNPTPHRGVFTVNAPLWGVGLSEPKPNLVPSNPAQGCNIDLGVIAPTPDRGAFMMNATLWGVA
jgi:hypothetical protein